MAPISFWSRPPQDGGGFLQEDDLPKIKTVFWKYNITGFTPYLFGVAEFSSGGKRERGVVSGTWFNKQLEVEGEDAPYRVSR